MQSRAIDRDRVGTPAVRGHQRMSAGHSDHAGMQLSSNSASEAAHKARVAAVALFGVCMAALLIAVVAIVADPQKQVAMPAGLLLVSTLLPAALAYAACDLDLMEPVQLISVIIAVNFGLRGLYVLRAHDRKALWLLGRGEYLENLPAALWLALVLY